LDHRRASGPWTLRRAQQSTCRSKYAAICRSTRGDACALADKIDGASTEVPPVVAATSIVRYVRDLEHNARIAVEGGRLLNRFASAITEPFDKRTQPIDIIKQYNETPVAKKSAIGHVDLALARSSSL
jgi:hypothetical protein